MGGRKEAALRRSQRWGWGGEGVNFLTSFCAGSKVQGRPLSPGPSSAPPHLPLCPRHKSACPHVLSELLPVFTGRVKGAQLVSGCGAPPQASGGTQGSLLLDGEAKRSSLGSNHFRLDDSLSPVLTVTSGRGGWAIPRRDGVRHAGSWLGTQGWGSALEESVARQTPCLQTAREVLQGRRVVLGGRPPSASGSVAGSA